jgi:hypothetical protein
MLSLMQLVAGARRRPPQIHSFAQSCQRALARASVSLAPAPLIGFQCDLGFHEKRTITRNTILRAIRRTLNELDRVFFHRTIVTSNLAPQIKLAHHSRSGGVASNRAARGTV